MLYTVAFPNWSAADAERVEVIRRQHDAQRSRLIAAHFTLVFGCDAVVISDYLAQIERVTSDVTSFAFACSRLKVEPTFQGDGFHVEGLPGLGRDALIDLHLKLHTGVLQGCQHPTLSFDPHITLATQPTPSEAESLADELLAQHWSVQGVVDRISVGQLQNQRFTVVADFPLRSPQRA